MSRALPLSVLFTALIGLFISGCATKGTTPGSAASLATGAAAGADAAYNDNALFLAGLPVDRGSPYFPLEQTDAWKNYVSVFEEDWSRIDADQLKPIGEFQRTQLAPLHSRADFVFYPFGGPDVLYVTRFFPDAPVYVLCGLEPVGDIQTSDELNQNLDRNLKSWLWSLYTLFNRSFFVTSEMHREFNGQVSSGVLSVIDLLLARTGNTIQAVQFGTIVDSGRFVVVTRTSSAPHSAVEITFQNANRAPQKLYYVRTNLAAPFTEHPGFSRFVKSLGTPQTLIKSASFLLHNDDFAAVRDQILATSDLILEDDSGIPYRYFTNPPWRVQLYGQYSKPDHPFEGGYQPALAADFANPGKAKPMGFMLGYGAYRRPTGLILAERIGG